MTDLRRVLPAAYYGVLILLLVLAITGTTGDVFPHLLAKHVSEDSEGWLLALLLPLWVQYARPRLRGTPGEWPATCAAAAVMLVVGLVCYRVGGVPPRIATLNETFLALAVLLPYGQLSRPVPRALSLGLPGVMLLLVLFVSGNSVVTDLAEGVVMLLLVPIGLDLVDREVLGPLRAPTPLLRWSWYAFLVVAPVAIAVLAHHVHGGIAGDALRYLKRVQESFVGTLLVEVYLAVLLPLALARRAPEPARAH